MFSNSECDYICAAKMPKKLKMRQNSFSAGVRPKPHGGSLQHSPYPLVGGAGLPPRCLRRFDSKAPSTNKIPGYAFGDKLKRETLLATNTLNFQKINKFCTHNAGSMATVLPGYSSHLTCSTGWHRLAFIT